MSQTVDRALSILPLLAEGPADLGQVADRLVALDDAAWGRLRLGPGWTQAEQAPEEVRTP